MSINGIGTKYLKELANLGPESCSPSMKKSYVSVLISVVKLELAAPNILKMMDIG